MAGRDSAWATVGSMNFDNPLLRPQRRTEPSLHDRTVVAELEKHFLADLDDARELDLAGWRARGAAARAMELGSALVRREL